MATIYYTATSLDGFIADREHSLDWLMQFPEGPVGYDEFIRGIGAIGMGSSTYEWLLRHLQQPHRWPYTQPAWVFTSRTLPTIAGADIRFVRGDVRPVHRAMAEAATGRHVWIVGGGDLAGQFHDQGLLDEVIVTIAAVTLGSGMPLLPRRIAQPPLRLLGVRQLSESFVELRYALPRR